MNYATVYIETVCNSFNSMNSTRNLNKNRKKSIKVVVLLIRLLLIIYTFFTEDRELSFRIHRLSTFGLCPSFNMAYGSGKCAFP